MAKEKKDNNPDVSLDELDPAKAAELELEKELEAEAKANVDSQSVLEKERLKAILKAQIRDEVREKMEAEYKAKQEAELLDLVAVEAKAEAEAEERARLTKETSNNWKKNPTAEMRRVFRCENPPAKESYVVLMQRKTIVEGTELEEKSRSVQANHAHQYILEEGAIEYQKQLKAFRKLEGMGKIKEVPPSSEGVVYIPEKQKKIQALRAELKKLEA